MGKKTFFVYDLVFIRNKIILCLYHIELHLLFKLDLLVCFIENNQVSHTFFTGKERGQNNCDVV